MHQQRPSMHARDSSGRQVSLLNDEPSRSSKSESRNTEFSTYPPPSMVRSTSSNSIRSGNSTPDTPGLIRADSYDSQITNDAHSPLTPTYLGEFGRPTSYTSGGVPFKEQAHYDHAEAPTYGYAQQPQYMSMPIRPYSESRSQFPDQPYSVTYEEDPYQPTKGGKRYPCRFKDSHGCDRTFTTSGHASRHSKIHTAEKAVNCSHAGCPKKFTRADNMKQHLETHYKDRSRSSAASKASSKSSLTVPAGVKKPTSPSNGRSSRASNRGGSRPPMMDPALFEPQHSISNYAPVNMTGTQESNVPQPHTNGLEALAAVAADFR